MFDLCDILYMYGIRHIVDGETGEIYARFSSVESIGNLPKDRVFKD